MKKIAEYCECGNKLPVSSGYCARCEKPIKSKPKIGKLYLGSGIGAMGNKLNEIIDYINNGGNINEQKIH